MVPSLIQLTPGGALLDPLPLLPCYARDVAAIGWENQPVAPWYCLLVSVGPSTHQVPPFLTLLSNDFHYRDIYLQLMFSILDTLLVYLLLKKWALTCETRRVLDFVYHFTWIFAIDVFTSYYVSYLLPTVFIYRCKLCIITFIYSIKLLFYICWPYSVHLHKVSGQISVLLCHTKYWHILDIFT